MIIVYCQEYERKDRGRRQDVMWEKIAERVNSESTEMNSFTGKKDAKQCRDKITNLNKKYRNVKDKSKATREGSEEIKGFPEFADLDEIWGTRDIVTNKYIVEAGTNVQPIDAYDTSTQVNCTRRVRQVTEVYRPIKVIMTTQSSTHPFLLV